MKIIKQKLTILSNFILLSIVYFIGIGFTAIFARIVAKDFLLLKSKNNKKTSYTNFKEGDNLEKMF